MMLFRICHLNQIHELSDVCALTKHRSMLARSLAHSFIHSFIFTGTTKTQQLTASFNNSQSTSSLLILLFCLLSVTAYGQRQQYSWTVELLRTEPRSGCSWKETRCKHELSQSDCQSASAAWHETLFRNNRSCCGAGRRVSWSSSRPATNLQNSGHCMYRTVVTICTTSLTFTNYTFWPHSVFMCFVWISEQTAIISLYTINWLVFITETECLLRGTDWVFIYNCMFCPHRLYLCVLCGSENKQRLFPYTTLTDWFV